MIQFSKIGLCFLAGFLVFSFFEVDLNAKDAHIASCLDCHDRLESVLPDKHPIVKGRDITACLSCHNLRNSEEPKSRRFSTRIHRAHETPDVKTDCMVCHLWEPGKNFGLPGEKISLGVLTKEEMKLIQRIFESWSRSAFLDALHANRDISCTSCHGNKLPTSNKTVGSDRCLACHGSYADLASKTTCDQFPNRNPHKSHLGEIDCSVCHQVHGASEVYCLRCHRNWAMKIPGGPAH